MRITRNMLIVSLGCALLAALSQTNLRAADENAKDQPPAQRQVARKVSLGFRPPPPDVMKRKLQTQDVKASAVGKVAARLNSKNSRPAAAPEKPPGTEIPPSDKFDWSKSVTAVQDQDGCGSCYDFASNAAFEANYVIRQNATPSQVGSSEQALLDCQGSYGCDGGWWDQPFDMMMNRGLPKRDDYKYEFGPNWQPPAKKGPCRLDMPNAPAIAYRALNWGYVDRDNTTFMPTRE